MKKKTKIIIIVVAVIALWNIAFGAVYAFASWRMDQTTRKFKSSCESYTGAFV